MLNPEFLKLLICPDTGQSLILADSDLISGLNVDIQLGKICNLGGVTLNRPLEGALVRDDRQVI